MSLQHFYAPVLCPLCEREISLREFFCRPCRGLLLKDSLHASGRCRACYFPLRDGVCYFCSRRNVFFDRHRSLYRLSPGWNAVLRKWKFGNERRLHRYFLPSISRALSGLLPGGADRIGFISSGRAGRDVRSYSPCGDLVAGLTSRGRFSAEAWSVGLEGDIRKKRSFRQSDRVYADRFFFIEKGLETVPSFDGRKYPVYLLIEDLFTTGATANAAARLLKKSGVRRVYVLSMLQREELDFS